MHRIRNPNDVCVGGMLIAVALLALWLTRNLTQGTAASMGPGYVPRLLCLAQIAPGARSPSCATRSTACCRRSAVPRSGVSARSFCSPTGRGRTRRYFSATKGLRNVPMPVISTSTTSPDFKLGEVPSVPIHMTSPG